MRTYLVILLTTLVIFYLVFTFVTLEYNPLLWSGLTRFNYALLIITLNSFIFFIKRMPFIGLNKEE